MKQPSSRDGKRVWESDEDRAREDLVAKSLSMAWANWGCVLRRFPPFSPIDFYVERAGRLAGLIEIKCRMGSADQYPEVFMSIAKWSALTIAGVGLHCRPAFVWAWFPSGSGAVDIRWIHTGEVDTSKTCMGGNAERGAEKMEPMILVPVAGLHQVSGRFWEKPPVVGADE